ncbi:DNA polymerase lambda isoform X1 [Phascolarctos cinereus]|uniref:DNA polymerase n=1 Tax=Phascolarctos cinereus TaxID=38626 RepID=A0A6P5IVS3_PHACI|nr:DNA polymerase lambda isoform X2 [Phascolarctos cinereus]
MVPGSRPHAGCCQGPTPQFPPGAALCPGTAPPRKEGCINCLLCARHCAKRLVHVMSSGPHNNPGREKEPSSALAMEPRGILKAFPKRKKMRTDSDRSGLLQISKKEEIGEEWLSPLQVHVLHAGIGRARAEIFERQILQHGGRICSPQAPGITHIVVDEAVDYERALRLLKVSQLPLGVQMVKSAWLSQCLQEQKLVGTAGFNIFIPDRYLDKAAIRVASSQTGPSGTSAQAGLPAAARSVPPQEPHSRLSTQPQPNSYEEYSDEEEVQVTPADLEALITGRYPSTSEGDAEPTLAPTISDKWVCAQPSSQKMTNHNPHITEKLEVLGKAYAVQGDRWRSLSYSKAISALKSFHKPVTSYQEACGIPGIGKSMAEKIMEIVESGHLRKLDHISDSVPVLELFSNIWGVGSKTAQMWYQQGFRTLEDIQNRATLTTQQAIGLKHYEDFLKRIPREEAAEIEQTVREAARTLSPGLLSVACGSYRRGKVTCGDVDVLVTHPDGRSHQGILSQLLDTLRQQGFLTDDLVSQDDNGQQQKYLGVCQLPGTGQPHRRLDIIVVPYSEFACALLYFTGSAHFNRSMRALAKTKGMSLSEHALSTAIVRNSRGIKVGLGRTLPTPTEKDVFRLLGLPYREPCERDW